MQVCLDRAGVGLTVVECYPVIYITLIEVLVVVHLVIRKLYIEAGLYHSIHITMVLGIHLEYNASGI